MGALDSVTILDLSAQLAALPKHAGYRVQPPREAFAYITFDYSGVADADRSRAAELERIVDETSYQLHHNYGTAARLAYPDGPL